MTQHVYFITDGTAYHDGDVEETYGVVVTTKSKRDIVDVLSTLTGHICLEDELVEKLNGPDMKFIPFDWEQSTNVIGVRRVVP